MWLQTVEKEQVGRLAISCCYIFAFWMALCFVLNNVTIFGVSRCTEWLCIQLLLHNFWTACSYVVTNIWKKTSMCEGKNIKGKNDNTIIMFTRHFPLLFASHVRQPSWNYCADISVNNIHGCQHPHIHTQTQTVNSIVLHRGTPTDWYSFVYLYVSKNCLGLCNNHILWRQLPEMWDKKMQVSAPPPL